jgi:hypothetical protein
MPGTGAARRSVNRAKKSDRWQTSCASGFVSGFVVGFLLTSRRMPMVGTTARICSTNRDNSNRYFTVVLRFSLAGMISITFSATA